MHSVSQSFYAIYDKISGFIPMMFTAVSDGQACRNAIQNLPATRFDDFVLYSIGSYTLDVPPVKPNFAAVPLVLGRDVKCDFDSCKKWRVVPWTDWRMPESKAELLTPLGLTKEEMKQLSEEKIHSLNLETSPRGDK